VAQLHREKIALESRVNALLSGQAQGDDEMEKLSGKCARLSRECRQLEGSLNEKQVRLEATQKQLNQATEELQALRKELSLTQKELTKERQLRAKEQMDLREKVFEDRFAGQLRQMQLSMEALTKQVSEIPVLKKTIASLQAENRSQNATIATQSVTIAGLQAENRSQSVTIAGLQAENRSLDRRLTTLQATLLSGSVCDIISQLSKLSDSALHWVSNPPSTLQVPLPRSLGEQFQLIRSQRNAIAHPDVVVSDLVATLQVLPADSPLRGLFDHLLTLSQANSITKWTAVSKSKDREAKG
jgi:predicted  nucleic acid-binding Zn-ribbon protein